MIETICPDIESLLNTIESLERRIQSADKLHQQDVRKHSLYERKIGELQKKLIRQEEAHKLRIRACKSEISSLKKEIKELKGENQKLRAQISRDYTSSSIPSSQSPNHKKISNSRKRTGRKPGAQPGHPHHPRNRLEPGRTVDLGLPKQVTENPDKYVLERVIRKQLVDIQVSVICTEYVGYEYRLKGTNCLVRTEFPDGINDDVNYGGGIKALSCLLNNYCNVSIRKVQEVLKGLTEGKLSLSVGKINGLAKEFTANSEKELAGIYAALLKAPYQHTDATYIRLNGKNWYVYVSADDKNVYYTLKEHKGKEGVIGTPVEEYQGTLIHDHDKILFQYGNAHQKCLAHELRYLQDSINNEPELQWAKTMKDFFQEVIHKSKTGDISEEECSNRYDEILNLAEAEYNEHPASKYYRDGYNTYRRLRDYKQEMLFFLSHPEIPPTNNRAEQMLRQIKRKAHQVGAFRSGRNTSYYCSLMSVVETEVSQKENIYDIMVEHFKKANQVE